MLLFFSRKRLLPARIQPGFRLSHAIIGQL
uniref:Uncharacterized protein n=1 Tax=Rhizophora mucronata TaxID=61149 RepID=A0A2P2N9X5_RHIMU